MDPYKLLYQRKSFRDLEIYGYQIRKVKEGTNELVQIIINALLFTKQPTRTHCIAPGTLFNTL